MMPSFKSHRGVIAPIDRANIDTDAIIPKQFLKSVKRTGFGESLFFDWRQEPNFILNKTAYKNATILVARTNFGCGSSREHAVWAVAQYGFKTVIAPAFADIFKNNCVKNFVLTVELKESEVEEIFQMAARYPGLEATVDLDEQRVVLHTEEAEMSFHFDVEPAVKERLVHGLDDIGISLKYADKITAFEKSHNAQL